MVVLGLGSKSKLELSHFPIIADPLQVKWKSGEITMLFVADNKKPLREFRNSFRGFA
jgi:hypothetical protein